MFQNGYPLKIFVVMKQENVRRSLKPSRSGRKGKREKRQIDQKVKINL